MSRFDKEKKYTAPELAKLLEDELNVERHPDTIRLWMTQGTRGVILDSVRIGGTRFSSLEAVKRFIEKGGLK